MRARHTQPLPRRAARSMPTHPVHILFSPGVDCPDAPHRAGVPDSALCCAPEFMSSTTSAPLSNSSTSYVGSTTHSVSAAAHLSAALALPAMPRPARVSGCGCCCLAQHCSTPCARQHMAHPASPRRASDRTWWRCTVPSASGPMHSTRSDRAAASPRAPARLQVDGLHSTIRRPPWPMSWHTYVGGTASDPTAAEWPACFYGL